MDHDTVDPFLTSLCEAVIRRAPPWPSAAKEYMRANKCKLLGWYDWVDSEDRPKIYLWRGLEGTDDSGHLMLARILTEEVCHDAANDLTHGAVNMKVAALLRRSAWREAVYRRLIVWLWKTP